MILPSRWHPMLMNLRGELRRENMYYQSKGEAAEELRKRTGQDFGLDADQWEAWLRREYPRHFARRPIRFGRAR